MPGILDGIRVFDLSIAAVGPWRLSCWVSWGRMSLKLNRLVVNSRMLSRRLLRERPSCISRPISISGILFLISNRKGTGL